MPGTTNRNPGKKAVLSINLPLELAEFILLEDGRIAVQFDQGLSLRHSDGCSWGTMGAQAYLSEDPSMAGLLYLLSQEMGFEQLDPPALAERLLPLPLTLPPSLFKDSTGNASSQHHEKAGLYSGQKGVVMMTDRSPSATYHASPDAWASYWARLCGLELVGAGWSGVDRYLPGGRLDGNPVGGLAIDLANRRVMGLSAEALVRYTANIPAEYQRQIAHVHLPWEPVSAVESGAMVIVRNPNRMQLAPDDDLAVLTTNFWQSSTCPESPEVQNLIELTAAYLVRMGQNPDARVFHGSWSQPLRQLARNAEARADVDAACLGLTETGIFVLRETLIPALLGKEAPTALEGDHGAGWVKFLPPE